MESCEGEDTQQQSLNVDGSEEASRFSDSVCGSDLSRKCVLRLASPNRTPPHAHRLPQSLRATNGSAEAETSARLDGLGSEGGKAFSASSGMRTSQEVAGRTRSSAEGGDSRGGVGVACGELHNNEAGTTGEGRPIVVAIRFRPLPTKNSEVSKQRSPDTPQCKDTTEPERPLSADAVPQNSPPEKEKGKGSAQCSSPDAFAERPAAAASDFLKTDSTMLDLSASLSELPSVKTRPSSSGVSATQVSLRESETAFPEWESADPWLLNERDGLVLDVSRNALFESDFVFGKTATNAQIYSRLLAPLVEGFTCGLNASVIAYGQTASGKTHTMFGAAAATGEGARELRSSATPKRRGENGELLPRGSESCSVPSLKKVSSAGASLTGRGGEEGLVGLALTDVFSKLQESGRRGGGTSSASSSRVCISMLEVYNERAIDLLKSATNGDSKDSNEVALRERADGALDLRNLTACPAESLEEALSLVRKGQLARRVGATALNALSSRSHTVLRISLSEPLLPSPPSASGEERRSAAAPLDFSANGEESLGGAGDEALRSGGLKTRSASVLSLVDLAGSEGVARAHTLGESQREGRNINRSLLALSRVIKALSQLQPPASSTQPSAARAGRVGTPSRSASSFDASGSVSASSSSSSLPRLQKPSLSTSSLPPQQPPATPFVGFRESKLTRLLSDCLGGSALTAMICLCAPGKAAYRETAATLDFARSARSVKGRLEWLAGKRAKRRRTEGREKLRPSGARATETATPASVAEGSLAEKDKADNKAEKASATASCCKTPAPPAFVYVPTGCTQCRALHRQLEAARAEIAFLKVELRQLRYVVENSPAFRAGEAVVAAGGAEECASTKPNEEASNKAQTPTTTTPTAIPQLAAASGAQSKAPREEENLPRNSTQPREEVSEVDYGGGVCFKKKLCLALD